MSWKGSANRGVLEPASEMLKDVLAYNERQRLLTDVKKDVTNMLAGAGQGQAFHQGLSEGSSRAVGYWMYDKGDGQKPCA